MGGMLGVAPKKVLYIQHAGSLGGSCMSLLYTLQALDRERFTPVVALIRPHPSVVRLYADAGIETLAWPGIITFEHTVAVWASLWRPLTLAQLCVTLFRWRQSEARTLALVRAVKPDIVHLNSAVLMPSARALHRARIPFIWHVREAPVRGTFGVRYGILRRAMLQWPDELIFLSAAEREAWVGGARGAVVHNFVDFSRFNRSLAAAPLRKKHGIPANAPVVLFAGGFAPVKGIFPLLEALRQVLASLPDAVCLMPGARYGATTSRLLALARAVLPRLGSGTTVQRVEATMRRLGITTMCRIEPFAPRIEEYLAMSDLVVFPAIREHFARPVIEAAAMAKPAVASRFPILAELIEDNASGLLVPPNDPTALARALVELLRDRSRAHMMGERAYDLARERYDAQKNVRDIEQAYDALLSRKSAAVLASI